jgi:hypothetical protein
VWCRVWTSYTNASCQVDYIFITSLYYFYELVLHTAGILHSLIVYN